LTFEDKEGELLISFYKIAEASPSKLKQTVDNIVSVNKASSVSDETLLKTVFLYFYDLMGINRGKNEAGEKGKKTLEILFGKFSFAEGNAQ
jgi:hypothetical protein